jgi:adenine-specific DNA-methyltransferase
LSEDVGPKRSLLVVCCAFRGFKADDFPNLTVRKIPKSVLSKCEWGKDDYSLEIKNLPVAQPRPVDDSDDRLRAKKGKKAASMPSLFDTTEVK